MSRKKRMFASAVTAVLNSVRAVDIVIVVARTTNVNAVGIQHISATHAGTQDTSTMNDPEVSPFIQKQIDDFVASMVAKLKKRAAKHPNDNFLMLDEKTLGEYRIEPLENHLIEEFAEFIATMDNPTPFLKDFAIQILGRDDYSGHSQDFKAKKVEFRDLANMCLILSAAYSARPEPKCRNCGMVGSYEEVSIHHRLGCDAL